jgi:hypothetical protein
MILLKYRGSSFKKVFNLFSSQCFKNSLYHKILDTNSAQSSVNFNFLDFGIFISIRSNKPGKQNVKINNPIMILNILGITNNKTKRKLIVM